MNLKLEAMRVQAIARLGFAREIRPDLARAEAQARVELAAAIIVMDEAADLPNRHNLQEQHNVNSATRNYAQALADLIRGEKA